MSVWVIVTAWLIGWVLAVRPAMRRTMLQKVCERCDSGWGCECTAYDSRVKLIVRGAKRERNGGDVAAAVWFAAWWPFWLAFVLIGKAFRALGLGVKRAVIRAIPLTGPELERRVAEQQEEIARLSKRIGATPP